MARQETRQTEPVIRLPAVRQIYPENLSAIRHHFVVLPSAASNSSMLTPTCEPFAPNIEPTIRFLKRSIANS
ncbi:MAG: hypothetical protein NOOUEUKL_002187 [Candidatus Fervidibacter sp.]